jgi:ubiquitin-protein ligase
MNKKSVIIGKDCINRLIRDVKEIIKNPLTENGIFYHHDETDMLKAYALIIGQKGTPYYGGYYFFTLEFSNEYPFSPPIVTFCTNGDKIRFNPNLYTTGKVCLSILNTWNGEQWSACQTIRSTLLTVSTLLSDNPLLNEPGVTCNHTEMTIYTQIIEFKNIEIAIFNMLTKATGYYPPQFSVFDEQLITSFQSKQDDILNLLQERHEKYPTPIPFTMNMYRMKGVLDWGKLLNRFKEIQGSSVFQT